MLIERLTDKSNDYPWIVESLCLDYANIREQCGKAFEVSRLAAPSILAREQASTQL